MRRVSSPTCPGSVVERLYESTEDIWRRTIMASHRRIIFGTTPLYIALCACMFGLNVLYVVPSRADNQVVINEQALSPGEVSTLERLVRGRLRPGRYWYDRIAGLWGYEGGPTVGFALAGLAVGGALKANASH